jgi:hypothetical protein
MGDTLLIFITTPQVLISSTFDEQLFCAPIPKVRQINCLFVLSPGTSSMKGARRILMKLTPGANAIKKFTPSLGITCIGV